jgi:hypothetical protein
MDGFVAWVGKLIGTMIAGPGAVVLGDPALAGDPVTRRWSPLTYRVVGVVLALSILVVGGMPWPVVAVVALVGAGLIGIERLRGAQDRE